MILYFVGKYIANIEKGIVWSIIGVYDSEEKAIANCDEDDCFIGPVILNQTLETEEWPGCYYPAEMRRKLIQNLKGE